ncbi:hypothetical protein ACFQRB_14210 [Halobaculum litoreum]|uniref:Uncharacterized protein n=1 Tax=Halobaculum litoreum TaxID=3031998 RepID=A0ABD5XW23_9EURY
MSALTRPIVGGFEQLLDVRNREVLGDYVEVVEGVLDPFSNIVATYILGVSIEIFAS